VDLAGLGVDDVAAGQLADQVLGLAGLNLDLLGGVERLDDVGVGGEGRVHGAQERHGGELARLVDADAEGVLLGDVDLDPAAALGDDAAGAQLAFARVVVDDEGDAAAAVQLADDDALGRVGAEL